MKIVDEDKVLLLLNSLLDSYEYPITILLYGKYERIFEDVSSASMNN